MRRPSVTILRVPVAVLLAGIVVLAVSVLPRIRFSFSLRPLLEANQEARLAVDALDAELPPRRFDQVCLLEWPRRIDRPELDLLQALGRHLEADPRIVSVLSLANVPVIEPGDVLPRVRRFPDTLGERAVYQVARRHPLLMRTLLSADGRSACLLVRADHDRIDSAALLRLLRERVPAEVGELARVRMIGGEVALEAMRRHMVDDLVRIVSLEFALFALLLPLLFRSLRGVVLPLVSVVVALSASACALVAGDIELSLIDLAIPGLVVVIGLCDAVHLLHRFEEAIAAGRSREAAIGDMLRHVGMACLFTSLTTAIGFGSLAVADHAAVRAFGLKAAMGVAISFACVMVTVPIGLAFWHVGRAAPARVPGVSRLTYGRPAFTVACSVLLVVAAGLGASRIVIDSHWLEELPADDPVVQDLHWYEENFAGLLDLDVRVEGDLRSPAVFRALERLQDTVLRIDGVNDVESYTQWVREAAGQPSGESAGLAPALLARGVGLLSLAGDDFPAHVVRRDFRAGRIVFRTSDVGSRRFFAIVGQIRRAAAELPPGVKAEVTGFMQMAHEGSRLVVTTMLSSFALSLVVISLLIALLYRSLRIALLSLAPNLVPIAVALGVTGWLGIPLRIGVVMIYSVGLGLAVDDTIHLLTRYRQERAENLSLTVRGALLRALRTSGEALVVTSVILTTGALCHLPADYTSLRDVGVLLTSIVVTALATDLLLLPVLIERFGGHARR